MSSKSRILYEMTWSEFEGAVTSEGEDLIALIPVGSTEQHGPHGTFGVDTGRAEGFSRRLAARLYPRAFSVPTMPFGVSPHHMNFPGTITLSTSTFNQVLSEIVDSLYRHGIRKYFFLNGHGGNSSPLNVLLADLRQTYSDVRLGWASFTAVAGDVIDDEITSKVRGHSCEGEMSQALYLAPWSVREDLLALGEVLLEIPEDPIKARMSRVVHVYRTFDEITANGALGDARHTSMELGEKIIETALSRLTSFLEEF